MRPRQGDSVKSSAGSAADMEPGMRTADRGIHRPECMTELLGAGVVHKIQIPQLYLRFTKSEETLDLEESLFSKASQVSPLQPGPRLMFRNHRYLLQVKSRGVSGRLNAPLCIFLT